MIQNTFFNISSATSYLSSTRNVISDYISKIAQSKLAKIVFLYHLYDSALANILALDTCRHGTSLPGYVNIFFNGGKINRAGSAETAYLETYSSDQYWIKQRKKANIGKIYVWNDSRSSELFLAKAQKCLPISPGALKFRNFIYTVTWPLGKRSASFRFSAQANIALLPAGKIVGMISHVVGFLLTFVTPTVKYRFTPQELAKKFENDPDLPGMAQRTSSDISPTHLGISGSLIQGLNFGILGRIKNKPGTFALGCVQLTAAIALTLLWTGIQTSSPFIQASVQAINTFSTQHEIISKNAFQILFLSTW